MEKISVTDEWLYQYMPVVDEAMIRELENNTDYEYRFSSKFERRMKSLVRREAHPGFHTFYRMFQRAAVLFLCIAGFLFILSMSVQAYRVKLFETIQSLWEDSVLYSYITGQEPEIFRRHEPGYIPEGYQEADRMEAEFWFSLTYANGDGKMITWDQMLVQDGDKLVVDTEYEEQVIKEISGKQIVFSLYPDGSVMAYCEYGGYAYLLIADDLGIEEASLMFEGIAAE